MVAVGHRDPRAMPTPSLLFSCPPALVTAARRTSSRARGTRAGSSAATTKPATIRRWRRGRNRLEERKNGQVRGSETAACACVSAELIFDVERKWRFCPFPSLPASRTSTRAHQEGREGLGRIAIFICERRDRRGDRRLFGQHGAKIRKERARGRTVSYTQVSRPGKRK